VRVLTICGSLQAASANRAALDVVVAHLRSFENLEVTGFDDLAAIDAFDPTVSDDAAPEAISRLRSLIAESDAIVVATPEYAGGMAGALMNALDWIVGTGELDRKPAVVISAGTTGGVHARRQLIRTLAWQGALVVGEVGIGAPRTKIDANGAFSDTATVDALKALADLIVQAPTMPADERRSLVFAALDAAGVERRDT
jgi:chromate reductase, NAD(P)H dehydrogenase (quinone)